MNAWCVRCDRIDVDFLGGNFVALGWDEAGDLASLPADRQPFRDLVVQHWPDYSSGKRASTAGQLYRLVHEMAEDDMVIYPNRWEKTINVGRITGGYYYAGGEVPYWHRRPVEWKKTDLARTVFTQGALFEIGSSLTLFSVKTHAAEFEAQLQDGVQEPGPSPAGSEASGEPEPQGDELSASRTEQATRDFIAKTFAGELKGHPFAWFFGELLRAMGHQHVAVSPPGKDSGVDIVATRDAFGFDPPILKVQCKSSAGKTGAPDVNSLLGNASGQGEFALFVSLGGFSPDARGLERTRSNLKLLDADELTDLIFLHYNQLSDDAQGRLPLRQVWAEDLDSPEGG